VLAGFLTAGAWSARQHAQLDLAISVSGIALAIVAALLVFSGTYSSATEPPR
jgi:hypothetical protein